MLAVDFLVVKSVKLKLKLVKMRELKFKTWDTERKRFVGDGEIIFKDYGETSIYVCPNSQEYIGDKCHHGESQGSRFIVVQFTGLKDKNGKEIYESDIVRFLYTDWSSKSDSDHRTLEQYLIDISHVGQVVFNDNSWEVKKHSIKYNDFVFSSINHGKYGFIEVIGNIYENPELLS